MKVQRLKGHRAFNQTFHRGRTYTNRFLVVFVEATPGEPFRVGFTSARAAGRPVKRNRIRRRLRAAFAEVSDRVRPGRRVVILGKATVLGARWTDLCRSLSGLLERAEVLEAE